MNALCITLQDGAIPDRSQYGRGPFQPNTIMEVFTNLDVLTIGGKDSGKLLISCLKDAEGSVIGTVNDLNVFQLCIPYI